MADLFVNNFGWAGDLAQTPSGDIATVTGSQQGTQRVLRRLLTPRFDLLFNPSYGLGLPRRIGSTTNGRTLTGLARAQMFQEAAVAISPPPNVTINAMPSGEDIVNVSYTDAESGQPQQLVFDTSVAPPTTS